MDHISGGQCMLGDVTRRSICGSLFPLLLTAVALPAAAAADTDDAQDNAIHEIIVTAEKKSERLQDVPIPISEVSASTLVANNEVRLQDFYTEFPGFDVEVTQQSHIQLL